MTERTLVLVKPDGVGRGLVGEVLGRAERRGYQLVALRMLQLDRALAADHYREHAGKPFFAGLVEFVVSGPLVAAVLAGPDVIVGWRAIMGATDPVSAAPGTIRGDLATVMQRNIVHGSDSAQSAAREIALYFPDLG